MTQTPLDVLLSPEVTAIRESKRLSTISRQLEGAREDRARLELAQARLGDDASTQEVAAELARTIVAELAVEHFGDSRLRGHYGAELAKNDDGETVIRFGDEEPSRTERARQLIDTYLRTSEARKFVELVNRYDYSQQLYKLEAEGFDPQRVSEMAKDEADNISGTLVAQLHGEGWGYIRLGTYELEVQKLLSHEAVEHGGHHLTSEYVAEDLRVIHGAKRIQRNFVELSAEQSKKIDLLAKVVDQPAMPVWKRAAEVEGVVSLANFERILEGLYDVTVRENDVPRRFEMGPELGDLA